MFRQQPQMNVSGLPQIADLGSARSATAEGYHFVEQQAPDQLARRSAGRGAILSAAAPAGFGGQRHFRLQDLYVQLGARTGSRAHGMW